MLFGLSEVLVSSAGPFVRPGCISVFSSPRPTPFIVSFLFLLELL